MRRPILVTALAALVAFVSAADAGAKGLNSVLIVGPAGPVLVEPRTPTIAAALARIVPAAPPAGGYVLVYPLLRGVAANTGRWYPAAGILCLGWRSGIEDGCTEAAELRGWFGSGVATGVFRRNPTTIAALTRGGARLPVHGATAAALELAFNQGSRPAPAPSRCVSFTARWSGPRSASRPRSFCVARGGGVYASGRMYSLWPPAARFVVGH